MNILILGANGQIAQHAIQLYLNDTDAHLTLYLRNAGRLAHLASNRVDVIEGNVLDTAALTEVVKGKDIVYANLAGDMEGQAKSIIEAMDTNGVQRLIFVTTLGIFDEVPGEFGKWNNATIGEYFPPYRKASDLIEASDLDYTVLRPAWLTDEDEIDYETTTREEPFKGTIISRKSVAALVVAISKNPRLHSKGNIGVNKPNTDGAKPAFM